MAYQGSEVLDGDKQESWLNSKWRPMMGWMYMAVCTMDFIVFPILWSLLQAMNGGRVETQWSPITLQGAGLFHMAMGAIIGVAAFGRTQEKLAGVNTSSYNTPASNYTPPPSEYPTQTNRYDYPTPRYDYPIATTASGKKIVPIGYEPEL